MAHDSRPDPTRVELHEAAVADRAFLDELLLLTHAEPLAHLDEDQRQPLATMQMRAQERQYRSDWPQAGHDIISLDGKPIGRVLVNVGHDVWWLVDIVLLPDFRGRGIGGAIINRLLDGANSARLPLRLRVTKHNPARRLYERLGFSSIDDNGMHNVMEKPPASGSP
ncbi:MAG: GNAT family N-acetyltransferase [Gammaproteobacteria bacterium]|nr:GNAT family N-acetyltransferase [Gammaproteobacteria bacterium]